MGNCRRSEKAALNDSIRNENLRKETTKRIFTSIIYVDEIWHTESIRNIIVTGVYEMELSNYTAGQCDDRSKIETDGH